MKKEKVYKTLIGRTERIITEQCRIEAAALILGDYDLASQMRDSRSEMLQLQRKLSQEVASEVVQQE